MLFKMILLGFAHAGGLFTHTQNAVNHYKNGYNNRISGSSRPTDKSFSKYFNYFISFTPQVKARFLSLIKALINAKLTRILVAMIENIRAEEKRNTRIAYNHQKQRMGKSSDDDRTRRDAKIQQIYNRMEFLRRSCRCRFICTGLNEPV